MQENDYSYAFAEVAGGGQRLAVGNQYMSGLSWVAVTLLSLPEIVTQAKGPAMIYLIWGVSLLCV